MSSHRQIYKFRTYSYFASPEAGSSSYLIIITPSKLHSANTPGTHPEADSLYRSRCFELYPCSARSRPISVNRGFPIFTVLRFTRTRKTSAAHRCGSTRYRSAAFVQKISRFHVTRDRSSNSMRREKSSLATPIS